MMLLNSLFLFPFPFPFGAPQVRQLAATELRKRVLSKDGKMWYQVPVDVRTQIKKGMLERMLVEPM
jgi:hypothetical protein